MDHCLIPCSIVVLFLDCLAFFNCEKRMNSQKFSAILAVVGCVTGVISLSWQIFDSYSFARESVSVGKVISSSEVVLPDKTRKIEWQFLISITNFGKNDVYVNGWVQGSKDGRTTVFPLRGEDDDKLPLQPGQTRILKFGEFTDAQLLERSDSLRQDMSAWISTSRGKVFPVQDFNSQFMEAVKIARARMSAEKLL